ncbi:hypothetical protein [Crocinitomix algicola]|uniref:hypothetical protein n=1 Tax=Crocinitomix algicola TaxID=1740263 RepID=UPI000871CC21|nr:hypothetical protein [Crocinitomix algicola]
MQSVKINRDEVFLLHFPKEDVLFSRDEQALRAEQLKQVRLLLNEKNCKTTILFQDIEGVKTIETTVESINEQEVILSKGVKIPTKRILTIEF